MNYRALWQEHHGPIPEGHVIHHVNGDRKDNRIENLRLLSTWVHALLHNEQRQQREDDPTLPVCTIGSAARRADIYYGTAWTWLRTGKFDDATPPCGRPRLVTTESVERLKKQKAAGSPVDAAPKQVPA